MIFTLLLYSYSPSESTTPAQLDADPISTSTSTSTNIDLANLDLDTLSTRAMLKLALAALAFGAGALADPSPLPAANILTHAPRSLGAHGGFQDRWLARRAEGCAAEWNGTQITGAEEGGACRWTVKYGSAGRWEDAVAVTR